MEKKANIQIRKLNFNNFFLFVDHRFDPFTMNGLLHFQPKRGHISATS